MEYDLIVVGAGPGGYVAALHAAMLGMKTLCVDRRSSGGGTCLHVGCIPSKTLLQASEHYAFLKDHGQEHGILTQGLRYDWPAMQHRTREVIDSLSAGIGSLFQTDGVHFMQGSASLLTPHSVEIEHEGKRTTVQGKTILLATGSEPIPLPFLPFDERFVLSSTGALQLKEVPTRLLVVGGGVIGVELASVYARLGCKVTVIEMLPQICPSLDASLSRALERSLTKQGINFQLGAKVLAAEVVQKGNQGFVKLNVEREGKQELLEAEAVLVAIGRRALSEGLALNKVGLQVDKKGFLPVDSMYRTAVPSIYAIGDLVEGPMLAHRASEEGYAVVEALAGRFMPVEEWLIPNVIYTNPEVATVGWTEQEAQGLDLRVGQVPMRAIARARCSGETEGFVKVIGHRQTGRLLGLHMMCQHASEMIGEGVIALKKQATLQDIAYSPHAHPTLSEAIKEACLIALDK